MVEAGWLTSSARAPRHEAAAEVLLEQMAGNDVVVRGTCACLVAVARFLLRPLTPPSPWMLAALTALTDETAAALHQPAPSTLDALSDLAVRTASA
jgi:hypothetical protein